MYIYNIIGYYLKYSFIKTFWNFRDVDFKNNLSNTYAKMELIIPECNPIFM